MAALAHPEHYVALWNMTSVYGNPRENFYRYMTGKGAYPYEPKVRTPLGWVTPTLYSLHDMLTLNEVFCRKDYPAREDTRVVVDIGSNIGISALYFLTRNSQSRCYLYEPDPANLPKLKHNLKEYEDRYVLNPNAVSYQAGDLEFGTEATGRYGGLGVDTGHFITVTTVTINDVLASVLATEDYVDVLKLDIEGLEVPTVAAINEVYLPKVRSIYLEHIDSKPLAPIFPRYFQQTQRGSICRLVSKKQSTF